MDYSCVIILINIVAHSFQGCTWVIAYSLQGIELRYHLAFCIHVYKLTYWLFQHNFNVHRWLNHLCSRKICSSIYPSIIEQRECLHHPRPRDLLISVVALAQSIHHKHVGREVYQHWTKLSCISMSNRQAKSEVVLAHSAIKRIVQDFSGTHYTSL